MKSMRSFCRYCALCLFLFCSCNAAHATRRYIHDFAFVNKSFARDLKLSVRLYESVERFVEPSGIPFYIVVPQKELAMFRHAFAEALASNRIKALPILMTQEEIFADCGTHVSEKASKMSGWYAQQVIKMCFGKSGIAKFYLTFDSDIYLTKKFPVAMLFKNGMIKTYCAILLGNIDVAPNLQGTFSEIKKALQDTSNKTINFVSGFGTWSSDILHDLESYMRSALEKPEYDFADLINFIPYEMQWYGNFVYARAANLFHPLPGLFRTPDSESIARRRCEPTEGRPWHYGFLNRKKEEPYINPCGKFMTLFNYLRHPRKYVSFYLFGDAYKLSLRSLKYD